MFVGRRVAADPTQEGSELLRGEPLAARIRREGRLAPDMAALFLRQTARVLQLAHERGIIHRDLKPANVSLATDPELPAGVRAKVLDFGIAKLADAADDTQLTQSGAAMGTPAYMSPEQWSSAGRVDPRADVYALGCLLHEMLTGKPPFPGPGLPEFMDQHRSAPPPRPSAVDPRLAPFDAIVSRALAKRPDDRFASAEDLARALPRIAAEGVAPARSDAPLPAPMARRRIAGTSRTRWLVAAATLLVTAVGITMWARSNAIRTRSRFGEQESRSGALASPPSASRVPLARRLRYQAPTEWVADPPDSAMRLAQYRLPPEDGDPDDASLVVSCVDTQTAGSTAAEIDRWTAQIDSAEPRTGDARQRPQVSTRVVRGLHVTLVDASGAYRPASLPGGPVRVARPDYRLRGAVVQTPQGRCLFKLDPAARTPSAPKGCLGTVLWVEISTGWELPSLAN
jgi:hypothetical protein